MKVLADTSVWVSEYFRKKPADPAFAELLKRGELVLHPWVYGELLLAGMSPTLARDLLSRTFLSVAPPADVFRFVGQYHPKGVGWVDVNLLVSCLESGALLWTHDKALHAHASSHGRVRPA